MPTKLVVTLGVGCVKWAKGLKVAGYFLAINEKPPKADSRIIVLDQDGHANMIGVWEAGALAAVSPQLEKGRFYAITCTGQKEYTKGTGWTFDVELFGEKEIEGFLRSYKLQSPEPREVKA